MSLPSPEERQLREIERELEGDATLADLARQVGERSHRVKLAIPAPRLGWALAVLLALFGLLVLAGGIAAGSMVGLIFGISFGVLFQGPIVTLVVVRLRVRRHRGHE